MATGEAQTDNERNQEPEKELNQPSVDFLLLADRAEAVNGKLYVMGGAWDHFFVQNFQQPILLSIAVGILVPWNATNQQHTLRITIEDSDAQPVGFNMEAGFTVGRPPFAAPGDAQRTILAVPAVPQLFPRSGRYTVKAHIDGKARKTVQFHLVDAAAGPSGMLPRSPQG